MKTHSCENRKEGVGAVAYLDFVDDIFKIFLHSIICASQNSFFANSFEKLSFLVPYSLFVVEIDASFDNAAFRLVLESVIYVEKEIRENNFVSQTDEDAFVIHDDSNFPLFHIQFGRQG